MGVSDPDGNYLSLNNYAINDPDFLQLQDIYLGKLMGEYAQIGSTGIYKRDYSHVYASPSRYIRTADGMTFKPFSGEIVIRETPADLLSILFR